MSGLVLRLAGPLQSWGEHSAFTLRDTQRFPTRSGLIGLLSAALGLHRGGPLTSFESLTFTVRIDRPGLTITDFHTIGGGNEPARTVPTAEGKRRPAGKGTIVTRRNYLSDAQFTVAVEGPGEMLARVAAALATPRWQPYLGRRSCPPEQPLLLRTEVTDPVHDLKYRIPIHDSHRDSVDIVTEGGDLADAITVLADDPVTFDPLHHRYRTRSVTVAPFAGTPEQLWHNDTDNYYAALFEYMGVH
jgi:CRISPR system Cascade subunit CasD